MRAALPLTFVQDLSTFGATGALAMPRHAKRWDARCGPTLIYDF